jgi:amino acid adenylation domain-containing protein
MSPPATSRPASVAAAFRSAVAAHPGAPALEDSRGSLGYAELDRLSSCLAGALAAAGVRPGDYVGVALERGFELVIALLAIVKNGAAYVPLDSAYPRERLALMIEETACRRVVCRRDTCDALPPAVPLFQLDQEDWQDAAPLDGTRATEAGPEQPLYVVFTSGSTGRPKGVVIPQRGALRLVFEARYLDFTPGLRIAQLSNVSFDAATFEIWGSLLHGGTLVFLDSGTLLAPPSFKAALERGRIDALFVTTALFNQLVRHDPGFFAPVGQVLFGGERADASAVRAALAAPPGRLVHVYGPTECTTFATFLEVGALSPDADSVPIGHAIGSTATRLLDPALRPVADGEEGQLYIGGDGLALGYLGRPALTAESFLPDPDSTTPGARIYRSGDLVRRLPDGETGGGPTHGGALDYVGRIDHQVKVRGFRIELGEIEAALARHPALAAQAVEARRDATGALRLVAYLVAPGGAPAPAVQALRSFLAASLPDYMIPTAFQFLDELPLTPNGKLDRRALPAFELSTAGDGDERVAPRDELETRLEKIFRAVLGAGEEPLSVTASFFELGGHSLLAIQLLSRLRDQLGVELPMRALFDAPTVAGLAAAVREGGHAAAAAPLFELPPEDLAAVAPLSYAQTSLYFLYRLQPESGAYNQPLVFELRGKLDIPRLGRAVGRLIARHPALRTRFVEIEGKPFQLALPAERVAQPPETAALAAEPIADEDELVAARIVQELYRPFELAAGKVQRVLLLERAPDRHVFLWAIHHIVADGLSIGLLFRELAALYAAFAEGQEGELEPLPLDFAEVARRQETRWSSGALAPQLGYWRAQLRDLPYCELPGDFLRPAVFSYRGAEMHQAWPAELTQGLKLLARKSRSSLFTVMLAAWSLLLSRWTGQDEVVLGIPQGGRDELDHEGIVGLFVNMMVLRARLAGDPSFAEALAAVRGVLAEGQQNAEVPFDKLVAELAPARDPARQPFFQISFQVIPAGGGDDGMFGDLALAPVPLRYETAKFDLALTLQDRPQGLMAQVEWATDLYQPASAAFLLDALRRAAEALVASPELRRSELPVPAWDERPRERPRVLSYAQQRMYFLSQWDPSSPVYNVPFATRWRGAFDMPAFELSLAELCRRHEVLRCRYVRDAGGEPQLVFDPAEPGAPAAPPLERVDLSAWAAAERERRLDEELSRLARRPFDLGREQPLHVAILRLAEDDLVVSTVFHHIAFDGWSFQIFLAELGALLAAGGDPARAGLPRLSWQYADFAAWQRRFLEGGEMKSQLAFWRDRLLDFEGQLELPTDRPRPARGRHRGSMVRRPFDPAVSRALAGFSQSRGATSFITHLAAWAALLGRLSNQDDLAVGVPVAGRHRAETEGLIGFFVNTLVLRLGLGGDPRFAELVDAVRERTLDAFAHQDLPFEKLVEELRPERDPARNPFFQAIFQWLPGDRGRPLLGGLAVEPIAPDTGTAKFDLNLMLIDSADGMDAALEHDSDLYDGATAERWLAAYQRILRAVAANPGLRLSELPLVGEEEKLRLLGPLRGERRPYPRDASLAELFATAAARRPDAVAVSYGAASLTYRQLDAASARVARALLGRGIGPGDFVGIFLERSPVLIAAILGTIRAGAAYAPFDLAYPPERLAFMIEDTGTRLLLTTGDLLPLLPAARPECLDIEALLAAPEGPEDLEPLAPRGAAALPAYVIYTSGSTGRPKGVVVPQRAIVRLVVGTDYVELGPEDRIAQLSNASFDAATFEIWGALLHGGQLVGIDKNTALQASALAAALVEQKISAFFLTAALFQQIASQRPEAFRGVRYAFFGGDRTEVRPVELAFEAGARGLYNAYGPTECTTFAVVHPVTRVDSLAPSIPIGRAIANTETLVLDRHLGLVPAGVVGELYLGGDGLAFGYHRRPALTAAAFVPHPYAQSPGERLYRTGDLVRRLPDGELEFVGRADFQIKLRGFRIELGEIEAALARQPGVAAQVVVVREDQPGDRRLVAYVQRRSGAAQSGDELRAALKAGLPDFMVPSDVVVLDLLPLTPNGKVDRRSLPAPDRKPRESKALPRNPLERLLARVWADVLGAAEIFLDDNFFELGGHSLLATKVFARLTEALGVELPLHLVFEAPTFEAFAAAVLDHLRGLGVADDLLALLEELETMSEEEKKALLES